MIDSHCHLICSDFSSDTDEVIARAFGAGVSAIVTISDAMEEIDPVIRLAEKYEHIFCTAGVHPHHAQDFDPKRDLPLIRTAASHPKCKAIGEIGLDYHYMNPPSPGAPGLRWTSSPKDAQQRVFEAQLLLAKELDLPAVIHCRDAVADVRAIVGYVKPKKLVIHCCTETWDDISWVTEAGYLLSFTGIITYPKAEAIRETVKRCPIDQFMVETDAPFLAPVPHRGKRCEPMHVIDTAKKIAEIKGVDFAEVDRVTTKTTREFYGI